jgi:hypothetical protein
MQRDNPFIEALTADQPEAEETAVFVTPLPIVEYLDELEDERRYIIARLRRIDVRLMRYGRLNRPTLPERVR